MCESFRAMAQSKQCPPYSSASSSFSRGKDPILLGDMFWTRGFFGEDSSHGFSIAWQDTRPKEVESSVPFYF